MYGYPPPSTLARSLRRTAGSMTSAGRLGVFAPEDRGACPRLQSVSEHVVSVVVVVVVVAIVVVAVPCLEERPLTGLPPGHSIARSVVLRRWGTDSDTYHICTVFPGTTTTATTHLCRRGTVWGKKDTGVSLWGRGEPAAEDARPASGLVMATLISTLPARGCGQ
ncbi:hypothetical protein F4780DRAFT_684024 [Xylariomycetidae sp. FL0641]|nr:hypothetical protein F4780DRAFT_684024 [Xylariomycetidae sp. FL0641]